MVSIMAVGVLTWEEMLTKPETAQGLRNLEVLLYRSDTKEYRFLFTLQA